MTIETTFSISAGKVIDLTGGDHNASPEYYSGIEFHRWLSDLSDDVSFTGDDVIDRTKPVASKRATDFILTLRNGYTITAAAIEHLYDVSIVQGTAGVDQKIWDAVVVQGNASKVNIIQNGSKLTDDWWNSNGGLNPLPSKGITHRFLLLVHDFAGSGGDIDGRKLHGTCRPHGGTWKYSFINGTERGKNYMFLDTEDDINNNTARATVALLSGISNLNEGRVGIDADSDTVDEFFYSNWTYGANSINDLYEYTKYLADDDSAATLYGLPAAVFRGITHKFNYDTEGGTGSWSEAASVTFGNGATAQLLAVKDDGATGTMWVQLLTGDAPADNDTITQGTINALIAGTPTAFTPKTPFIGQSTGSAIIGALGEGVSSVLSTRDSLLDLDGATVSPPDVVNFSVASLEVGDGSVTVYPWDGVAVDDEGNATPNYTQMTLATALSGAAETSVVVNAIPDNTPDTGSIRIVEDSGVNRLISYTAHNGVDTFTIPATSFTGGDISSIGNGCWVAYLDKVPASAVESFTYTYGSDVKVVVEVRDPVNQMVPFITGVTLGNANQTINTIRNNDF